MPKRRALSRIAYQRAPSLGADGRMSGTRMSPETIDPSALLVDELSKLSPRLGRVYSGSLYAGPNAFGAEYPRFMAGDDAKGIQVHDQNGILCFSVSWVNGSGRIGRIDAAGITWANGKVYVDGDAVIPGTITAGKLLIGSMGFTFLEEDRLVIGNGYVPGEEYDDSGSVFSGFIATINGIGGWYRGTKTWEVDSQTGHIVTRDTTYPYVVYTDMGGGSISFSNYLSGAYKHTLNFMAYSNEAIGEGDSQIGLDTNVSVFAEDGVIRFKNNLETDNAPTLALYNYIDNLRAFLSGESVYLTTPDGGLLQMQANTSFGLIYSGGSIYLVPSKSLSSRVEVESDGALLVRNGQFKLKERSSDPDDPGEGYCVLWQSDGTGAGDDGDIMMKITAGATTKTATLVDFSAV